ncbi:hypothetical protein E2P81_ATG01534 [Venturia nashicola]|uniref:Uncharacterized protein n=1 Tax=Venturia nashicola TaxID=86259 RepID=A0A4Z1PHB6_9PEZI|nr:hypothetical protein E6O75_ATG01577 [Venturia nashicola]TLD38991.1 hypothetical protein E2P81_ATG01534 [Venturia nashicola]
MTDDGSDGVEAELWSLRFNKMAQPYLQVSGRGAWYAGDGPKMIHDDRTAPDEQRHGYGSAGMPSEVTIRSGVSDVGFPYAVPWRNITQGVIGQESQPRTRTASQDRFDIALDRFDSFDVGADMPAYWS